MGFSKEEYWSGLPCPSPGDLLNPGIKPGSPALQEDSLLSEPSEKHTVYAEVSGNRFAPRTGPLSKFLDS